MIEPAAIERSEGGGAWLINHLPTILWHRRLYVIIPAVLLFVAGLVTAYSLPTLYRSTATMLPLIPRQSLDGANALLPSHVSLRGRKRTYHPYP